MGKLWTLLFLTLCMAITGLSGWKIGVSLTESKYNAEAVKIAKKHAEKLREYQQAADNIAFTFSKSVNEQRIKYEREIQKFKKAGTGCKRNSSGDYIPVLSDTVIRLLYSASTDNTLLNADYQSTFVRTPEEAATALPSYTYYTITEYNKLGLQVEGLLDYIREAKKACSN